MTRRRPGSGGGKARRKGWPGVWLTVGLLAVAVAIAGTYLVGSLPPAGEGVPPDPTNSTMASLEQLLGPLHPAGVRLRVADGVAAQVLVDRLEAVVSKAPPGNLRLETWSRTTRALLGGLVVGDRAYPLRIDWEPPTTSRDVLLAVVIDDMGRNLELETKFLDLPLAITPSLLPNLRDTAGVASLATSRGREFLLHLPMQPRGYPQQNPGEGALLEEMGEAKVRSGVRAFLQAVPGASGVNNHMGSRFTELRRPMTWVLEELRAEGLYFLDSVTSAESVGAELARELGVGWARRDVFLDNVRDVAAVTEQLDRAVRLARKNGSAVAIGHPHRATLKALSAWAPGLREAGVQVVPLSRLVHAGDGV